MENHNSYTIGLLESEKECRDKAKNTRDNDTGMRARLLYVLAAEGFRESRDLYLLANIDVNPEEVGRSLRMAVAARFHRAEADVWNLQ